jgi:hypothetical protein
MPLELTCGAQSRPHIGNSRTTGEIGAGNRGGVFLAWRRAGRSIFSNSSRRLLTSFFITLALIVR